MKTIINTKTNQIVCRVKDNRAEAMVEALIENYGDHYTFRLKVVKHRYHSAFGLLDTIIMGEFNSKKAANEACFWYKERYPNHVFTVSK